MDAAGVIAHYVLDGNRPLTADSSGNTTYYLYGLGAIGEKTTDWAYSLPDGVNTPRQLANLTGDITLSARYTPWGDTLESYGTGNFTFGYFGGIMDAATGLLYVGNGQYYDPVTGRFLTRDAKPNSTNPYVPWDPTGALLGPLGLLALVYGRKKKGSKAGMLLVLLLVGVSVGMTLAACGEGQQSSPTAQVTAVVQPISSSEILVVPIANGTPGTPFVVPVPPTTTPEEAIATACATAITPTLPPTSTPTPAPTPIPIGSVGLNPGWGSKLKDLLDAYKKNNNNFTVIDFTKLVLSGEFDSIVEDSGQYNDSGFRQDVAHAATHWLYINQKELSENALLNWLGAMDSAHTRYFGWISTGILGEPGRGEDLASYVVNQMLNPPEEWKRSEGDYWNGQPDSVNQHPYTWGNRSLWTVDPAAKLASLHYPPPVRTIPGGDSWYLLTLAQSNALHPYKR